MDNALDNFNEVVKCASGLRKEPFEFVKKWLYSLFCNSTLGCMKMDFYDG